MGVEVFPYPTNYGTVDRNTGEVIENIRYIPDFLEISYETEEDERVAFYSSGHYTQIGHKTERNIKYRRLMQVDLFTQIKEIRQSRWYLFCNFFDLTKVQKQQIHWDMDHLPGKRFRYWYKVAYCFYKNLYQFYTLKEICAVLHSHGHHVSSHNVKIYCKTNHLPIFQRDWVQYYKIYFLNHYPELRGLPLPKIQRKYYDKDKKAWFRMTDRIYIIAKLALLLYQKYKIKYFQSAKFFHVAESTLYDGLHPYIKYQK